MMTTYGMICVTPYVVEDRSDGSKTWCRCMGWLRIGIGTEMKRYGRLPGRGVKPMIFPSMLPLLSSPCYTFFLLSILPSKGYPIGNTFIAQRFTSAHMSIECGLPGAAKIRYDPCHHPGLNIRCFRSHGLV